MTDTTSMDSALLDVGEGLRPILDFIDGQRAEIIRRGYSETAAETMVVELYRSMVAMFFRTAGSKS